MTTQTQTKTKASPSFSVPSIVAVIAAGLSFASNPFFGGFLALLAVLFGFIGIMLALSPKRRGGLVSTLALVGGALGIVAAIIKAAFWLL